MLVYFGGGVLGFLIWLIVYPSTAYLGLALNAKRWHDRNKSGWWSLLGLIPVLGLFLIVFELGCYKGTSGPNKYGPDPNHPANEAAENA